MPVLRPARHLRGPAAASALEVTILYTPLSHTHTISLSYLGSQLGLMVRRPFTLFLLIEPAGRQASPHELRQSTCARLVSVTNLMSSVCAKLTLRPSDFRLSRRL